MAAILNAQDATPSEAPTSRVRRSLFTAKELDRARAIATELQKQEESYIRASHDDEVIVLAPYVIEGENSLLMARLRRHLEEGSGARRNMRIKRLIIDPAVLHSLRFTQKNDHQFFRGPTPGTPADRPDTGDWLGLGVGIFRAIVQKRMGDIFRVPDPVTGR